MWKMRFHYTQKTGFLKSFFKVSNDWKKFFRKERKILIVVFLCKVQKYHNNNFSFFVQ